MGALDVLAGMVMLALALWSAALALSWSWSRDEKRTAALAARAERLGMDFVATDALHVTWEPFPLFGFGSAPRGHEHRSRHVARGSDPGFRLRLRTTLRPVVGVAGRRRIPRRRFTCAVAGIDGLLSEDRDRPRHALPEARSAVGATEIRFESEAFNRRVHVECEDPRFATALMDQRMMAWLLKVPAAVAFELREDRLLCVSRRLSPASIPMLLEVARGFHERIPRVVRSLYPPRSMCPSLWPERSSAPERPSR